MPINRDFAADGVSVASQKERVSLRAVFDAEQFFYTRQIFPQAGGHTPPGGPGSYISPPYLPTFSNFIKGAQSASAT